MNTRLEIEEKLDVENEEIKKANKFISLESIFEFENRISKTRDAQYITHYSGNSTNAKNLTK